MTDDQRFQQLANRMDTIDKKIKNLNKSFNKLSKEINTAEVAVSQYKYQLDQMNSIIKQLVLVTSVLQQRTGGKIENDELAEEYKRLESDFKTSKPTAKRS